MHIVHLAIAVDLITSMLQDLTDDREFFDAPSRERRLEILWRNYRDWAHRADVADVAGRRLFTTGVLTNNKVVEVSQKVLSGTACRYMIVWAASLMRTIFGRVLGLPLRFLQLSNVLACFLFSI